MQAAHCTEYPLKSEWPKTERPVTLVQGLLSWQMAFAIRAKRQNVVEEARTRMNWLNILKAWFGKQHQPQYLERQKYWTMELHPKRPLEWNQDEIAALLTAEQGAHFCYVHELDDKPPLQSVVLGFDLSCQQILLDEFFPSPAPWLFDQVLTLSLPTRLGVLRLDVEIREKVTIAGSSALVANIIGKAIHQDRRLHPRVAFAKQYAPAIDVLLPMAALIKGHAINLSEAGLLMTSGLDHKPEIFTQMGECKITFTEQFTFVAKMRIKELHFHRKPFKHNSLRIVFTDLTAEQKDQLREFISRIHSLSHRSQQTA
jgi:hypothetical protein